MATKPREEPRRFATYSLFARKKLARREGFEPPTLRSVVGRSSFGSEDGSRSIGQDPIFSPNAGCEHEKKPAFAAQFRSNSGEILPTQDWLRAAN
jgi:hypothetical protein